MKYWLLKSEPDVYSLDQLQEEGTGRWDGVRNYQARNNLRAMKIGDLALFYHSRSTPPHLAGLVKVEKKAYPDPTAFDPTNKYYDPKSGPEAPRWFSPDVTYLCHFPRVLNLPDLKKEKKLAKMVLVNNSRLSVQPVTKREFDFVCQLAGLDANDFR